MPVILPFRRTVPGRRRGHEKCPGCPQPGTEPRFPAALPFALAGAPGLAEGRRRILLLPSGIIPADLLFQGAQEILIRHKGDLYHLRITRNDKLILTK